MAQTKTLSSLAELRAAGLEILQRHSRGEAARRPWGEIAYPHQRVPIWSCTNPLCGAGSDKPGECERQLCVAVEIGEDGWVKITKARCGHPLEQKPWSIWNLQAGRSSGKTRTAAETVIEDCMAFPGIRYAAVGVNAKEVRGTMIEGESGLLACAPLGVDLAAGWQPSVGKLTFPNGSIVECFYSEAAYNLRGPQFHGAWADEISSWADAHIPGEDGNVGLDGRGTTWSNLLLATRLKREGFRRKIIVTSTPRPLPLSKEIASDPDTHVTYACLFDNAESLSPEYVRQVYRKWAGTRMERQEIFGQIIDDNPSALWHRDWIDGNRSTKTFDELCEEPGLVRVVAAVDPAVSSGEESCEHGIVVAGLGHDGHAYILEDGSCKGGPEVWVATAASLYYGYKADRIVVEKNQGGDLLKRAIHAHDSSIPVVMVHASRGKETRAEPVAMKYSQGMVHHVKPLRLLEDSMCQWDAALGKKAKNMDRIDALVWGLTDFFPSMAYGGKEKVFSRLGGRWKNA